MPYINKKVCNIGLTDSAWKWATSEAKENGMSLSVYIEQLIRRQMKIENQLKAVQ